MMNKKRILKLKAKFLRHNGVTMVELIIALVVSLFIVATAGVILLSQSGVFRITKSVSVEQERLNNAFSDVKYSLRMAGFDYGNNYYSQINGNYTPVLPVQVNYDEDGSYLSYPAFPGTSPLYISPNSSVPAGPTYPPYEVLISYSKITGPNGACTVQSVANQGNNCSTEFSLGPNCKLSDFYNGQIINLVNYSTCKKSTGNTSTLCVTGIQTSSSHLNVSSGSSKHDCPANYVNNIPPSSIYATGFTSVAIVLQYMYYWGNSTYQAPLDSNNNPLPNVPGTLYKCQVFQPSNFDGTGSSPSCLANTVVALDENVVDFSVVALPDAYIQVGSPSHSEPYAYILSISSSSSAAITGSSPAFSVNTKYNTSLSGSNPVQGSTAISGYNVIKTLKASVLSKNIYIGH